MHYVELKNVEKAFDDLEVLKGISISVSERSESCAVVVTGGYLILDPDGNPGYVQLRMGADNLSSLEITFLTLSDRSAWLPR